MKNIVCVVFLSAVFSLSAFGQQVTVDLILLNGKVFTVDSAKPSAEAIAIRGERIVAVGTNDEIKKLAGAKTRLIDLQNRAVTAGFNDAHFHFMPDPKGFHLQFKTLEPSWEETLQMVKNAVQETLDGQWKR